MQQYGVAGYSGRARRILHFRPARCRDDADSECDDYADRNPERRYINQVGGDREPDDDDDEADDVGSE